MKLILSRKGFDGSAGGGPSPILPDGRLVPLPIPDADSPVRYGELRLGGLDAGRLVGELSAGRWGARHGAHLDPDLDARALPSRPPRWRPLFGQSGAAQAHLRRRGVGVGDLFLFFGWFRPTEWRAGGGIAWARRARERHVLFGWLQVGRVHRVGPGTPNALPYAVGHPHLHGARGPLNTLYVARDRMRLPGLPAGLPGAGLFETYRRDLCLTAPDTGRRSLWRLPRWWSPRGRGSALSYHGRPSRWSCSGRHVRLHSVGRGQEFVLDLADYPEAIPWIAHRVGESA